jgi:hypothetical protein
MGIHALVLGSLKPIPPEVLESPLLDEVSILTEPGCAGYYGPEAKVSLVASVDDFTAVRDAALSVFAAGRVDAVLVPTEFGIATGGLLRTCYGFDGMGFETAHAFANKYVMKQRLAAAGVPVTPFRPVYRIDDLPGVADELGWPLVVKPVFGSGTVGVTVVASLAELSRFDGSSAAAGLKAIGLPLIAERHVDIEVEYHCDCVVVDGETVFAAVSRYLSPVLRGLGSLQGSYHLPAEHPDAVAVRELHAAAVASLGMRSGVTHLEAFKTADGFLVGEVACRPGGGGIVRGIELQYGVDLWGAFMETSLGMRPGLDPVRRDHTVVTLMLPARPGRITRLSTAEELGALRGVTEVSMLHAVGDVISDVMYSTNINGLVFLEAAALDDVDSLIRSVADAYVFAVSQDDSIPA